MGEEKKDELDKVVIKNDTLRKYFPRSFTPKLSKPVGQSCESCVLAEKGIGRADLSKTARAVAMANLAKLYPVQYRVLFAEAKAKISEQIDSSRAGQDRVSEE